MSKEIVIRGTKTEQKLFSEVHDHYTMSQEDLDQRINRKNGFNDADKMFASYLDEANWPYSSLMFDPRPYTVILEKSARLIGNKPKGRLVPREGGDDLGAMINNELLSYQWEDNARLGVSMITKWIEMDQNARKYGSAFALAKWLYLPRTNRKTGKREVFYDGPNFVPLNSRDVLTNPSYAFVNKWFQHREWLTLDELQRVNDSARKEPVYKNLDLLRESLREDAKGKGDRREAAYTSKNKEMRGLTDYMGADEVYKTIEIITEYRNDRWISFSPRHGVVIRDIPNPMDHGEIPVVHLKYYPLPDDLYGVSELEPVSRQIRAINAHLSAYNDAIALSLRPPLHINPINTRMHTIEWNPEAKWLMNNPNQDVQQMQVDTSITQNFQAVYSVLVSSLLTALGETSQGVSNIDPFQPDKTATEVRDSAFTRNVRDNMNQIFLSEAIKKQTMFWHSMNQQFMFKGTKEQAKIIRIVGRDAVEYFKTRGLSDIRPTEDDLMNVAGGMMNESEILPGPTFPVDLGDGQLVPKFQPDQMGYGGNLIIEPGDVMGNYDYIPDVETMKAPSQEDVEKKLSSILAVVTNPAILQMLQAEGKRPKVSELLIKMFESTNVIKDAEVYFEDASEANLDVQNQLNQSGGAGSAGGAPTEANGAVGGVAAPQGMANGQPQQQMA